MLGIYRKSLIFGCFFCVVSCCANAEITLQNSFIGIKGKQLKNVEARIALRQKSLGKLTITSIKRFYNYVPKEINESLQPYGYFHTQVKSHITHTKNRWSATYRIVVGKPLRVTSVDIRITGAAKNDKRFIRYLARFPLKRNAVFVADTYNDAKHKLFTLASRHGYLKAKMVQSRVQISLKNRTCKIYWRFDSGSRYFFGQVAFTKTPFSESFLRRFLSFTPGKYYSQRKLQKTTAAFSDSDLFYSVLADPQIDKAKKLHVPTVFHLMPRYSRQYAIGAGYGTDTGVRGLLGLTLRNFNKNGHHITGVLKASMKKINFDGHYIIPGPHPATDYYDMAATYEYRKQENIGISRTMKIGPSYVVQLRRWKQTVGLSLQQEWDSFYGPPSLHSTLLMPNVGWLRIKTNDPIRPTKGYRINISVQGAAKKVLSKVSFVQLQLDVKRIQPLTKRILLVLRGTLGYTAVGEGTLPLSLRFTAGGAQSVRGYGYQDIGPGNQLAVASGELRFRVYKQWYAAGFLDVGNASNNLFSRYHQGAGVGVVWLSPIGAIELTWGFAISEHRMPWRIQFSMGPEL